MEEAPAEFLDPDLLKDAEATNQRPALSPDGDELKTTRLPPISAPPPPVAAELPLPSFPPPPVAPALSGTMEVAQPPVTERQPTEPPGKPSWLRGLLTTTFPPPDTQRNPRADAPIGANLAGSVFAVLGVVFSLVALVTGLKGAPMDPVAPIVAAALVLARALVAVGAGALSFAMFRQAERLLVRPPG
jgi:hypothetical protein